MNEQVGAFQKQFAYYKQLADRTVEQITADELFNYKSTTSANSIAVIMNHIAGNQLSRFTDFLTADGEKEWRNRDAEFEEVSLTKEEILKHWNKGWDCLFAVLKSLQDQDLNRIVYIRNIGHTVFEALLRQLAHYASHVGQIVHIGKTIRGNEWQSLSIPKGSSKQYNENKFNKPKARGHFTDEFLKAT